MNAADTETRGMDVVASWNVPFINRGDLELNFLGALMQTQIRDVKLPAGLPSSLFQDRERSIIEDWQPKSRFTLSGLYQLDQFSASVMVHRYGSYTVSGDGNNPKKAEVRPQVRHRCAGSATTLDHSGFSRLEPTTCLTSHRTKARLIRPEVGGSSTARAISSWTPQTCSRIRAVPRPSASTADSITQRLNTGFSSLTGNDTLTPTLSHNRERECDKYACHGGETTAERRATHRLHNSHPPDPGETPRPIVV